MIKLVIFVASITFFVGLGALECGENEVEHSCANPCPPTCEDPFRQPCPTVTCSPGCVCEQGYIRNDKTGKCETPEQCAEGACGVNEVLDLCAAFCPPSCQVPDRIPCPSLLCGIRCACKDGFLRDERNDTCVAVDECPEACGQKHEWSNCATACPKTCQNKDDPPVCIDSQSCKPGCVCQDGLVLEEKSKLCIHPDSCKIVDSCKGGQYFSDCASYCPSTCQSLCREPEFCAAVCIDGCVCPPNTLFDESSETCIPKEQCPPCPKN